MILYCIICWLSSIAFVNKMNELVDEDSELYVSGISKIILIITIPIVLPIIIGRFLAEFIA